MDIDPRHLTTLAGYLEQKKREKQTRRSMREAGPQPYIGDVADSQKARRQIQEMIESENTDWESIRRQTWQED